MTTDRTWEISDIDGSNRRTVTLAEYRAELEAAKAKALANAANGEYPLIRSRVYWSDYHG